MGYYDPNNNWAWVHVDGEPDPAPMQSVAPVYDPSATAQLISPQQSVDPSAPIQSVQPSSQIPLPPANVTTGQTPNPYFEQQPVTQSIQSGGQPPPAYAQDLSPGNATINDPKAALEATASTQPRKPIPMLLPTGGSPGGLTMVGRAAQTLVPGAINAQTEAELANARGINEGAKGLGNQADAIDDTLADLADRKPWQDQMRDNEEKAKQAEAKRWYEIAEEEKGDAIDPDRYFKGDYALGKKVLSIVGMAVGGYLQGLNGGENQFERTLDTLINRDIDAQRAALHAKAKGRSTEKSALRLEVDKWGDQLAAEEKLKSNMWDATAHRLDGLAKRATGKTQQENAIAAANMARAHALEARLKFAELMASRAAYTPASGGGARINPAILARMTPDQRTAYLEEKAKLKKAGATDAEASIGALTGEGGVPQAIRDEQRKHGYAMAEKGADLANSKESREADRALKQELNQKEEAYNSLAAVMEGVEPGDNPEGFTKAQRLLRNLPVIGGNAGEVASNLLMGEKGRSNRQKVNQAFAHFIHENYGGAVTPNEMELGRNAFFGAWENGEGLNNALGMAERSIRAARAATGGKRTPLTQELDVRK